MDEGIKKLRIVSPITVNVVLAGIKKFQKIYNDTPKTNSPTTEHEGSIYYRFSTLLVIRYNTVADTGKRAVAVVGFALLIISENCIKSPAWCGDRTLKMFDLALHR